MKQQCSPILAENGNKQYFQWSETQRRTNKQDSSCALLHSNKAGYTASDASRIFERRRSGRTYGWTDGQTYGRTNSPSYRGAKMHLKRWRRFLPLTDMSIWILRSSLDWSPILVLILISALFSCNVMPLALEKSILGSSTRSKENTTSAQAPLASPSWPGMRLHTLSVWVEGNQSQKNHSYVETRYSLIHDIRIFVLNCQDTALSKYHISGDYKKGFIWYF